MASVRPRRSVLYMPGANARAIEKAKSLACDAVIFDLEDAVSPDQKAMAREQVADAVRAGGYGRRELIIRINALASPWGAEDVAAAVAANPHAVLLPKVETAHEVRALDQAMSAAGAYEDMAIWCMIETPKGVLNAQDIAISDKRVGAFVMGTSDLVKDLRARHTADRTPVLTSLSLSLLAARAAGIACLDGVYLDLEDEAGFAAACEQGRDLGFDGKTLIHPKQIDAANQAFAPSPSDVDHARQVIAAFEAAEAEGKGVAVLDGKLVEVLHVAEARETITLADAIAERSG
ncbi:MAG: CoA ester lyase [Pseudomonadota bacterium]